MVNDLVPRCYGHSPIYHERHSATDTVLFLIEVGLTKIYTSPSSPFYLSWGVVYVGGPVPPSTSLLDYVCFPFRPFGPELTGRVEGKGKGTYV